MIFTCPRCGRAFALEGLTGLICPCVVTSEGHLKPQGRSDGDARALPSPAGTQPGFATSVPSSVSEKGGSGQPGPAVSTGSRGEKPRTGTPFKPVELPVKEAPAAPSRAQFEEAEAWMGAHFFKKKGQPGAVGDEWKVISAACERLGFDRAKDGSWREWVYSHWQDEKAKVAVVKALILAGLVKSEAPQELSAIAKTVLAFLTKNAEKAFTLDDLNAQVSPLVGQTALDELVDAGKAYEPVLGEWRAM